MKQETADAMCQDIDRWDSQFSHKVVINYCKDLIRSLVSEDEFDPVYYWEHLSEEDKHKVCDMQNTEVALREWEEYYIQCGYGNIKNIQYSMTFPDWLRSK